MSKSFGSRDQWAQWLEESILDVRLDDEERRELSHQLSDVELSLEDRSFLRNLSFKLSKQKLTQGEDPTAILRWLERVIKVLDNSRHGANSVVAKSWFSPGRECITGIIEQLKLAKQSIDICVFTIACDEITEQILKAHQRGIAVRIITDNDKRYDRGSDVYYLAEQGIPVKVDTTEYHMHHKFALFDNSRLINGSFNWTRSASKYNQEDLTLSDDQRYVSEYAKQFEKLWQRFPSHQPSQR